MRGFYGEKTLDKVKEGGHTTNSEMLHSDGNASVCIKSFADLWDEM